jgi:hypothetical protein
MALRRGILPWEGHVRETECGETECAPARAGAGRRLEVLRAVSYVDPQHCWVLAAPPLVVAP